MEMDPRAGLRHGQLGEGLWRLRDRPDLSTLRRIPWLDRTAMVLCDVAWHDGSPVVESPRQVLIAQFERALEKELHHVYGLRLSSTSTRRATPRRTRKTSRPDADDPLHPRLPSSPRRWTSSTWARYAEEWAAGIPVEFSKGEAWYGQHEVNFRYADAVTSADRHTIYKNGDKEIAFLNDISATFMAKPSEKDIGSSCHVHLSLFEGDTSAFVDGHEETDVFRHFLGGMRSRVRELALFIAPSVNSYKRYATESWAPTSISWGRDNRTCGFRVVGHGQSRGRSAASRGPTSIPTSATRPCSLPAWDRTAPIGAGAQGQRLRGG